MILKFLIFDVIYASRTSGMYLEICVCREIKDKKNALEKLRVKSVNQAWLYVFRCKYNCKNVV